MHAPQPEYPLQSPEFFRNPYPTLHQMRAEAPVHYFAPLKLWMLTRYDHIDSLIRDPRFSSQRARQLLGAVVEGPDGGALLSQWERLVFFLDPPRHTRARSVIQRGMAPISLESLRPMVAGVVRRALEQRGSQGELDAAVDLADFIALETITEAFNVPVADRPIFRRWTSDLLKPAGAGLSSEEVIQSVRDSSKRLFRYVLDLVEARRGNLGEDLVSRLLVAVDNQADLVEELGYQCINLIGAGYLTVANQLSNMVLTLLENPGELKRLRESPQLLKGAVEESLRYDSSVLTINRLCTEDIELGGQRFKQGELVFGCVAAANRDPAVFPEPDRFDISRSGGGKHLTFGYGGHYCPGAALTRLQMEETLKALLKFPRWEFGAQPLTYGALHLQDRGPKTLPIRLLEA